jgi:YceI-like domain
MSIAGAYRLGPESGRLLVRTTRTGLGAKAGHDLTAEISKTRKQVLHTAQHPTITFRSGGSRGSAGPFTLDGELTIMGITRPVTVQGGVTEGRILGGSSVVQSRWGIRPYSAFFGAFRLSDEVKVDSDVASPQTVDGAAQPAPASVLMNQIVASSPGLVGSRCRD